MNWTKKLKVFFELIKFEHTLFALPFAYLGMLTAAQGRMGFGLFFLVTLAMVCARTAGMTLNRIIDVRIDANNPRTKNRALVTGDFSMLGAWAAVVVSTAIFFLAAFLLNPLCLKLSPAALILLCGYHYVKRFSFLCHFTLGAVLAVAPMGGWLAVTGSFSWTPVFLSAAVLFWVAGFDIIYSLQDLDFDRAHGLFSIPVMYGQEKAIQISGYSHLVTVVFLILFGILVPLGILYWVGVAICAALLRIEQMLIFSGDLSRVNVAFFTINGWIGVLLLLFTFLETFR